MADDSSSDVTENENDEFEEKSLTDKTGKVTQEKLEDYRSSATTENENSITEYQEKPVTPVDKKILEKMEELMQLAKLNPSAFAEEKTKRIFSKLKSQVEQATDAKIPRKPQTEVLEKSP